MQKGVLRLKRTLEGRMMLNNAIAFSLLLKRFGINKRLQYQKEQE